MRVTVVTISIPQLISNGERAAVPIKPPCMKAIPASHFGAYQSGFDIRMHDNAGIKTLAVEQGSFLSYDAASRSLAHAAHEQR